MKNKHVPTIGRNYWISLIFASIFGANLGDFLSDSWGLGHVAGLPILFGIFALVLLLEHFDNVSHWVYYWFGIIVVRAAATNIGDIFGDLRIAQPLAMAGLAVVLGGAVILWKRAAQTESPSLSNAGPNVLSTNPWYWASMLSAGSLGTVLGDFSSFSLGKGLGLGFSAGNIVAAAGLGVVLAALFFFGRRKGLQLKTFYYWMTIVLIRAAGTAAGDSVAHSRLGLPVATLVTGVLFMLVVFGLRDSNRRNEAKEAAEASIDLG